MSSNIYRSLLAWAALLAGPSCLTAADPDLAIHARALLKKHCWRCHGQNPAEARAGLDVLAHVSVTDPERRAVAVRPGSPDASQLVEFVEVGAMPPGVLPKLSEDEIAVLRQWTRAGAPVYPEAFDDLYVLDRIREDVTKLGGAASRHRYLSLHAPLALEPERSSLADERARLLNAVNALAVRPLTALTPIDEAEVVFRIDLTALGWDRPLFREVDPSTLEPDPDAEPRLNLWDVLLLEYPFGRIYADHSEAYRELKGAFLGPADQVRPVAFVRGDWLSWVLGARPEWFAEMASLAGNGGGNPPPTTEALPVVPLPAGMTATPVHPLDARTVPDLTVQGNALNFRLTNFRTLDGKESIDRNEAVPRSEFDPATDSMIVEVLARGSKIYFEVAWIAEDGEMYVFDAQGKRTEEQEGFWIKPAGAGGWEFEPGSVGVQRLVLFASHDRFAYGRHYRWIGSGERVIDRLVHAWPPDPEPGSDLLPFVPGYLKRTAEFTLKP